MPSTSYPAQVTSYLNAGEEDALPATWQGRLADLGEHMRSGFQQLADPPLDLPGSQVLLSTHASHQTACQLHQINRRVTDQGGHMCSSFHSCLWTCLARECCPGPCAGHQTAFQLRRVCRLVEPAQADEASWAMASSSCLACMSACLSGQAGHQALEMFCSRLACGDLWACVQREAPRLCWPRQQAQRTSQLAQAQLPAI